MFITNRVCCNTSGDSQTESFHLKIANQQNHVKQHLPRHVQTHHSGSESLSKSAPLQLLTNSLGLTKNVAVNPMQSEACFVIDLHVIQSTQTQQKLQTKPSNNNHSRNHGKNVCHEKYIQSRVVTVLNCWVSCRLKILFIQFYLRWSPGLNPMPTKQSCQTVFCSVAPFIKLTDQ